MANEPRVFVLVHGAFRGGWCYARVADLLRAHGHRVFTPTLTGLGERSHLAHAGINCSTHIRDILNVIEWERLTDVILCGHSYGGLVVAGVADAVSDRIAALVYVDSVIPEDGKSLFDLVSTPEGALEVTRAAEETSGMIAPVPASAFNVNAADRDMVDALCTPQPLATFSERLKLTGAYMTIPKKVYVLATEWTGPTRAIYDSVKDAEEWSTFAVACGHDIMLDAPNDLAEILLSAMPHG